MQIQRDKYLNDLIIRMGNGMIKVVTGIRRCGKTYLLFNLFREHLIVNGIKPEHIIEVSLDDDRFEAQRDAAALSLYLRERIRAINGQAYVLLDEVQYAISPTEIKGTEPPRLYGVLNGLLRLPNVDVCVTGSNSRMLSTDVLTEFRGRGDEVRIRPLSFAEFMQGFDGDVYLGWAEYARYGGMPLLLSMKTEEQKVRYLENLFTETYIKDIVSRNGIAKTEELERLVDVMASMIGCATNPSKIQSTFKSELHSNISVNTISHYLACLEESFLIEVADRYDVKGRKYIGTPKKYYFEDMGLRNARLGFRQVEQTHIMENVVYNELCARGFLVDIGSVTKRVIQSGKQIRKNLEVDFVANLGSQRFYIQSALQLPDSKKLAQEISSLREINDSFKKIVVVREIMKPTRDENGILFISLYDFLMNPDSLNW